MPPICSASLQVLGFTIFFLAWAAVAHGRTSGATPLAGQQPATNTSATKPSVQFDHASDAVKIFDLDLQHGESFLVHILNTCPEEFDYPYVGVDRGITRQFEKPTAKLRTHPISVVYDDRFGGYVFSLVRKAGVEPGSQCVGGETLKETTFIVSVREEEWGLSFSGGFTFSGLTNPVFGVKTEQNVKRIFREQDKEDERKLGAASFVHVFHDALAWKGLQPAIAFGLGINSDNRAEYFVGGGLRLGDRATVSAGMAYGSIARLPNGVTFDTPITDDNVLNNLGTQVVRRYFVALSFAFIDTKDRLTKPFAAASAGSAPESSQTPRAGAPDTTTGKIIQALAQSMDTYESISDMKGVAICGAEVKAGEKNTVTVTLIVKDASVLTGLTEAIRVQVAEALNTRVQKHISPNPPTVTDPVTFGQTCQ